METGVQGALRHVAVAREAVKHAAYVAGRLLGEDGECVLFRLTRVNHDRQPAVTRQPDLLAEYVLLRLPRREVVVVIEPDLPEAARQRLCGDGGIDGPCRARGIARELSRGMRMHADRKPHLGPAPADLRGLRQ